MGPVAEWLGKALQKLLQRFEPARDLDTKPLTKVRGFFNVCSVKSMPRSGWGKWKIWLKLASNQRRHLAHNERSEYA